MIAGADSIDDLALLRHGGMNTLFTGRYAPSALGSFLRTFTFGHVRQLDAFACLVLTSLSTQIPPIAHDPADYVYVDVKSRTPTHLPSGEINANAAWLVLAVMAFNLPRKREVPPLERRRRSPE